MLSLKDFKKLAKSQILNDRFIVGGGSATEYYSTKDDSRLGDDYKYDDGCVAYSGHVTRGGNEKADPKSLCG